MPVIRTEISQVLNVPSPILIAPMAFATTRPMMSAAAHAGAFPFHGAGFDSSSQLVDVLRGVRSDLGIPDGEPVPMGVGFISWILKMTENPDSQDKRLEKVLAEKPKALWFAFGDDLNIYVDKVRAFDAGREHKTVVFVMVNSVEQALRAANEWKVDVLVVQGIEAGGHGGANAPPLSLLLSAVLSAIPEDGPLVVAAGGISNGPQIAALLTMGASGVVCGTRFLYTEECAYSPEKKDVLLRSDLGSTKRGMMFDEMGKTLGWPAGIDGRAIANGIWQDAVEGLAMEERLGRFEEAKGKDSHLIIWAGEGVGLTKKIEKTQEVVRELRRATAESLTRASILVVV
ncbi:inosine monophosphate dehydrogenase [Hymenopellis radicata]|nr:inosine monophosphate dehydrogenase [Hymenopellis radicata]